jgi:hypothetical protein
LYINCCIISIFFNPTTFLCMSQARTWISNCFVLFSVSWDKRWLFFLLYLWNCWPSSFHNTI